MSRRNGFTLIEVVCVVAVLGLVIGVLTNLAVNSLRYDSSNTKRARIDRDVAMVFDKIVHGDKNAAGLAAAEFLYDSPDRIDYVAPNSDRVIYYLDADKNLIREVGGNITPKGPLIKGVKQLVVSKESQFVNIELDLTIPTPNDSVDVQYETSVKMRNLK